jgi:transcriptional regulator with XRE-family HTH domain
MNAFAFVDADGNCIEMDRESGKKLLGWRLAKGLTQKQAAGLAEIDQASWHQYENGRVPRDTNVIARLMKLTRKTEHALALDDFAETETEKARRKARANVARRDESGPLPDVDPAKVAS